MTHRTFIIFLGIIGLFLTEEAQASAEKLTIPRFVCLRSKKVNVHVGPGKEYPTDWTFVRQDMPVEIIAEFDTWRQIRDFQGTTGWVHKSLLSGKRTALIKEDECNLRERPEAEARVVAILKESVIAKVKECKTDWCRIDVSGHTGWIPRKSLWGVYDHEEKFK